MIINAHLFHTSAPNSARLIANGAVVIDQRSGTSREIPESFPDEPVFEIPRACRPVLIPGLIDIHAHLPQSPAVARREASLLP